jgi:hypothetical protein
MEEKLSVKVNALEILERQLTARMKKKTIWNYRIVIGN